MCTCIPTETLLSQIFLTIGLIASSANIAVRKIVVISRQRFQDVNSERAASFKSIIKKEQDEYFSTSQFGSSEFLFQF